MSRPVRTGRRLVELEQVEAGIWAIRRGFLWARTAPGAEYWSGVVKNLKQVKRTELAQQKRRATLAAKKRKAGRK